MEEPKFFRMRHGESIQQRLLDQRKNRRIHSDTETQRQNSDSRESRVPRKGAQAKAQIRAQFVRPEAEGGAAVLFSPVDPPNSRRALREASPGSTPRRMRSPVKAWR